MIRIKNGKGKQQHKNEDMLKTESLLNLRHF